jgi:hypothetical protein
MDLIPMDVIEAKLRDRYETQGYSMAMFRNDWNLLVRVGVHPQVATVEDLQKTIMGVKAASTKGTYAYLMSVRAEGYLIPLLRLRLRC